MATVKKRNPQDATLRNIRAEKKREKDLSDKVKWAHYVLGTLITWLAQSANAPIRRDEAEKLLLMLNQGPGAK